MLTWLALPDRIAHLRPATRRACRLCSMMVMMRRLLREHAHPGGAAVARAKEKHLLLLSRHWCHRPRRTGSRSRARMYCHRIIARAVASGIARTRNETNAENRAVSSSRFLPPHTSLSTTPRFILGWLLCY